MEFLIYKIVNRINNKIYIGQTTQRLSERWRKHNKSTTKCTAIYSAIQKYGKKNFEIKIIARCSSMEEMNHREEYCIKLFNSLSPNGYNLKTGGSNQIYTKEVRLKISESLKGERAPWFGKKGTDNPNFGLKRSEDVKRRISNKLTGRKLPESHRAKCGKHARKPIRCNETGQEWVSIREAAKYFGVVPKAVWRVLKGERKRFRSLTFSYITPQS